MNKSANIPIENTAPASDICPAVVAGDVSLLHQRKYSVPEASRLSGIGETNLRTIIKKGELPVLRVTKSKVLIMEIDLEKFLQSRHGIVQAEKVKLSRLPSLPDYVTTSKYLKRKAS